MITGVSPFSRRIQAITDKKKKKKKKDMEKNPNS